MRHFQVPAHLNGRVRTEREQDVEQSLLQETSTGGIIAEDTLWRKADEAEEHLFI